MSSQHWSWFPHSEWSLSEQGRRSSVFYNLSMALPHQHFHDALLVTWATQTSSRMKETLQDPDPVDENYWELSWRLATTGKFWRISIFFKSRSMYINWKYGVNYQEETIKSGECGKQPKCPSTDEWKNKWFIHTMEYWSAIKKEWNSAICSSINMEIIILSGVSQTEKDKYYILSLICRI